MGSTQGEMNETIPPAKAVKSDTVPVKTACSFHERETADGDRGLEGAEGPRGADDWTRMPISTALDCSRGRSGWRTRSAVPGAPDRRGRRRRSERTSLHALQQQVVAGLAAGLREVVPA